MECSIWDPEQSIPGSILERAYQYMHQQSHFNSSYGYSAFEERKILFGMTSRPSIEFSLFSILFSDFLSRLSLVTLVFRVRSWLFYYPGRVSNGIIAPWKECLTFTLRSWSKLNDSSLLLNTVYVVDISVKPEIYFEPLGLLILPRYKRYWDSKIQLRTLHLLLWKTRMAEFTNLPWSL